MILFFTNRFRLSNLLTNQSAIKLFRCTIANALSSSPKTDGETTLTNILKSRFQNAHLIDVKDTSSGCGSSYEIIVVTNEFVNMRTVNQHRLVSDALSKQLPNIHAIRIFTGTDKKQFVDS